MFLYYSKLYELLGYVYFRIASFYILSYLLFYLLKSTI